jgi:methylglutaconyl-CoA hydratase
MNPTLVLFERLGPAAVLTMNRPEKRNALNRALVAELNRRVAEAAADPAVRVGILAANGPAFCAGIDLAETTETLRQPDAHDRIQQDSRQLAALYRSLVTCPKPTIAAVSGPAVAGGAGLVTACDLAIAVPDAKIGYPEVHRGIVPAIITPMLLRVVSGRTAKYVLLTGNLVDAPDAVRLGLYNAVVPSNQLRDTVLRWANDIARGAPLTLTRTKEWLERCIGTADLWTEGADASAAARFTPECAEGLAAFHEKRAPNWAPSKLPS